MYVCMYVIMYCTAISCRSLQFFHHHGYMQSSCVVVPRPVQTCPDLSRNLDKRFYAVADIVCLCGWSS